jgi:hypothetical protein
MNYVWRWKLCYCYQALDVLNYEHVILYIHMYELYSCAIKFMLFIICQLLIIAYIIIYIYRFKVFVVGSICPVQDNWTGSSTDSKRLDSEPMACSISGPVLLMQSLSSDISQPSRLQLGLRRPRPFSPSQWSDMALCTNDMHPHRISKSLLLCTNEWI